MRKFTVMLLFLFLVICPVAYSYAGPRVLLNGSELVFDVPPVIEEGRTLVPMRAFFEKLGASVSWNGETQTITAVKDGTTIVLTIGETVAIKNGQPIKLDVAPRVSGGRTLVPLRFISESLGATVEWGSNTKVGSSANPVITVIDEDTAAKPEKPTAVETQSTEKWLDIDAPGDRKIRAVAFTPEGSGPFPVIVVLHGTEGLRQTHVDVAREFSRKGFIAVAGAWFGGSFAPVKPTDAIDSPKGPDFKGASLSAVDDVMALVNAAKKLPRARSERVGLWGHSRGATMAVLVASAGGNVQAVVSNAALYTRLTLIDTPPIFLKEKLEAPLLILHGTEDEQLSPNEARTYEAALKKLGKPVESYYFQGGRHNLFFVSPTNEQALKMASDFFKKHLMN